jgi:hypothetical protein
VPGVARVQAAWLSPEICIVVVEKDNFPRPRGRKADALECAEGSSPDLQEGERGGRHRGLRAGHVLTGVARGLGRAQCFLAVKGRKSRGTG